MEPSRRAPEQARAPVSLPGNQLDLLVAAGRERTVLAGGFLAGLCVFFAPLVILALGLLAAYLRDVAGDGTGPAFGNGRSFGPADFRAVFAPAVNDVPLLLSAGLLGAILAQFRRWMARRTNSSDLAAGARPFFPEFALLYVLLIALTLGLAATRGGWPQVHRLLWAWPEYLLFMVCAAWLAHAVWQYCFRSLLDLLASDAEREAAVLFRDGGLRTPSPRPRAGRP